MTQVNPQWRMAEPNPQRMKLRPHQQWQMTEPKPQWRMTRPNPQRRVNRPNQQWQMTKPDPQLRMTQPNPKLRMMPAFTQQLFQATVPLAPPPMSKQTGSRAPTTQARSQGKPGTRG